MGDHIAQAVSKTAFTLERGGKLSSTEMIYMQPPSKSGYKRSGNLRASIRVHGLKPMSASIGPSADYAIFVHEGTRFMRARPFMDAALDAESANIDKILEDTGLSVTKVITDGL
jgi:HK97 gp10 family phage protein